MFPTEHFTIFLLQNPWTGVFELDKVLRSTDYKALKLRNIRSGWRVGKPQFQAAVFIPTMCCKAPIMLHDL